MKTASKKPPRKTVVRYEFKDAHGGSVFEEVAMAEVLAREFEQGALLRARIDDRFEREISKAHRLRATRMAKPFTSDAAKRAYEKRIAGRINGIANKRAMALHPSIEARRHCIERLQGIIDIAYKHSVVDRAEKTRRSSEVRRRAGEQTRADFCTALSSALKVRAARGKPIELTANLVLRHWPNRRRPSERWVQALLSDWKRNTK